MITGIPGGLSFARFDALGMHTRLTARGFHDEMDWCTRTATPALASGVIATSPSIPGVLRPALRCVTCRTLTSVFDRLRSSQLLQVPDLGPVLLLRRLEDPLPQPPYPPLLRPPVDPVPPGGCLWLPGPVLRSVHLEGRHRLSECLSCHRCLTCPSVPAVTGCSPSTAHLPTSACFRSRAPGPDRVGPRARFRCHHRPFPAVPPPHPACDSHRTGRSARLTLTPAVRPAVSGSTGSECCCRGAVAGHLDAGGAGEHYP